MKKTAVDFIIEKLAENGVLHSSDIWMAKSIEKAQIIDFADSYGTYLLVGGTMSAGTYNETFNKEV